MQLLFGFLILCVLIGYWQKKRTNSFESYTLSRGAFSNFAITCTIIASFTGGGSVLGTIEKSTTHGFYPLCALFGFVLQLLVMGIIASRNASRFTHAITLGDMFDGIYGPWLKKVVALLWLCLGFGALSVQIKGMGSVFAGYGGFDINISIILGGLCLLLYCALGGIRAVIYTDIIQLCAMFLILPFCLYYLIFHVVGLDSFLVSLKHALHIQPLEWNRWALLSAFVGFLAGDAFIPAVMQRFLLAKDSKQIIRTFCLGAVGFLFFVTIASCIGIALAHIKTSSTNYLTFFIELFSPQVRPLITVGLFAVVISSADSYLNSLVSTTSKDLLGRASLRMCHILTVGIGTCAIFTAIYLANLFDALLFFYKFWGPIVVIPILGLFLGKNLSDHNLKLSVGISALIVITWNVLGLEKSLYISDTFAGLVVSCILFLFFRITRKNVR